MQTRDGLLVCSRGSSIDGTGLFAAKRIRRRQRIIEYVGRKICKKESVHLCSENNPYIFTLNDKYDLDGSVEWNLARFINHSCAPNCSAEMIRGRIWIVAERVIEAGEELSYDYGYDLEDYQDHPCRCGAPNCRGYIVSSEYAADLARREASALGKQSTSEAPQLSSPHHIAQQPLSSHSWEPR